MEAGADIASLFSALTIDNARVLGLGNDIGSIEVGKLANLLLLNQNPLESVSAYDSIDTVILWGKAIKRLELSATQM